MRSISLRRPVALGVSTIVLLSGLVFMPSVAFAEGDVSSPTVSPTITPEPSATPEATPKPFATPVPTPEPTPEPTVTPEPSATPEPTAEPTATPEPSATPEPTPEPSATPTEAPIEDPAAEEPPVELAPLSRMMAQSVSGFNAGNIISDAKMFDGWAMTEGEIQAFLNKKIGEVGGCSADDCLAIVKINTFNKTWRDTECAPYTGANGETAARIIYKVQRACGVSAKALLVLLQKEQGLLTSRNPTEYQLRAATGAGCPDSPGGCTSALAGFFYQVYAAADLLTWYGKPSSGLTHYPVGKVSQIAYQANMPSCGSSGVLVQNRATAALYYYTPYQPNAAALANMYGTGDACSAYGNRNFWRYYTDWFGDPTGVPASRLAGADRYETAAAVSRSSFSGEAPVVYITTGELFPDALSAAPAAAKEGGPLLLVNPAFVPPSTRAEIERLKPKRIVIVGLEGGVSAATAKDLSRYATIERIGGVDRYETSRKLAEKKFAGANNAYLATGEDFPDALSASAAAGASKVPVVLVNGFRSSADAATIKTLRTVGVKTVRIAGGPGVMTPALVATVKSQGISAIRLDGIDRYLTSVRINTEALDRGVFTKPATAYIATGVLFADALSGAAAAGRVGSPLYVSQPNCVSPELRAAVIGRGVTSMKLLGGTGALSDKVAYLGC